jgi:TIGR03009 family protein
MRMFHATRNKLFALSSGLLLVTPAAAQPPQQPAQQPPRYAPQQPAQAAPQQPAQLPAQGEPQQPLGPASQLQQGPPAVQPAAPPEPPVDFQLNQIEQAYLDQVLNAWQQSSDKIDTFRCVFERWEYSPAFGPGQNIPLNKDKGEISFKKPDKGSFQITEINTWQANPIPPGQQPPAQVLGDWILQKDAIGEHWVCDGTNIYEYRQTQKQLVQRTLPENMRGKAIADGPLPFLFGAKADKLKERYWMKASADPDGFFIVALPKFQQQAADFSGVEVILDRDKFLPTAMRIHFPDKSRHMYKFDVPNATVNGPFDKIRALFQSPSVPWGWQRVVEQAPVQQAAQPMPQPR